MLLMSGAESHVHARFVKKTMRARHRRPQRHKKTNTRDPSRKRPPAESHPREPC